jgi:hypothetical protein
VSRYLWPAAALITVGFMAAEYVPGRLSTAYAESLGPLFAGAWLALAFHIWWKKHQEQVLAMPSLQLRTVLGVAVVLLLLGGFRLLWVDPFLFVPMFWPLVEVAWTLWRRSQAATAP